LGIGSVVPSQLERFVIKILMGVNIMRPLVDESTHIDDIKLKDIPKDMAMYNFIGKTIEKLIHTGESVWIKFTDGTYGHVFNQFPIMHYGRDIYNKHREKGELNICGYCSDEDWISPDNKGWWRRK